MQIKRAVSFFPPIIPNKPLAVFTFKALKYYIHLIKCLRIDFCTRRVRFELLNKTKQEKGLGKTKIKYLFSEVNIFLIYSYFLTAFYIAFKREIKIAQFLVSFPKV